MEGRGKRKAASKPTIVDLCSESEDESISNKRTRTEDTDFEVTERLETVRRRWPTKKDKTPSTNSKEKAKSKKNKKTPETNSEDLGEIENNNEEQPDGANVSNTNGSSSNRKQWQISELLAEVENIDMRSARNIVNLFQDENTIPFICRYRRDMIPENVTPERLRDIKNSFNDILCLRKKAEQIIGQLDKEKVLTNDIRNDMLCAKTMEELEFLYAPYKPASKGSLADRAKALGLEKYAEYILLGKSPPLKLEEIVDRSNPDLDSTEKVTDWISHILSHIFSKNTEVLEELRRLQKVQRITLKSTKAKSKDAKDTNTEEEFKYENYFNFENAVKFVKPHQVLAINRGEKAKILSVKVIVPDTLKNCIKYFIRKTFLSQGVHYSLRTSLFEKSFEECYSKKLQPYLSRQIRSDLNEKAKKASIEVFAKNLKQLLLMSPLKGEKILGIDPGFSNGCKLALISETADVLETGVIHPHARFGDPEESGQRLTKILTKNNCKIIALGNGTACRETEFWLTKLYAKKFLNPSEVKYSIISEQGASIYSCSDIAKKEFPNLDVNLVSAVSIARRLNDPLSEYVKIEPRHIGVGMYQHDITEKLLSESLNEVVMECVSFVGVDINTAGITILKHIAGLTASRAQKIIEHRAKNGPFKTRKDLLKVKTIGEKTFTQCAGFIRIEPKSVGGNVANLLDCTWVHPESYDIARKIILKSNLDIKKIGQPAFIETIKAFANSANLDSLEKEFKTPKERIKTVLEALQRELFQDYRSDIDKKPLFKQGVTKMSDLKKGSIVTGAVNNITHFGAFVDIGVDRDGLIHTSNMNGMILNIGDRVEVSVIDVDIVRKRIQLKLESLSF